MSGNVDVVKVSRSGAYHSRADELVRRSRRIVDQLDSYFREVAEVRDGLRDEGSLWGGPAFEPMLELAYGEWLSHGPHETRVELDRLGEAPIGNGTL